MIKLIKSTFYNEKEVKEKLIAFIKDADILSMGAECRKFEENFSARQGRKFSVSVSSGSNANLLLLQALMNLGKLKRGDRVGISALTWATNAMPVIQLGLEPIAIDCTLSTLNVSPQELLKHIEGLKAFFLTNALGLADDIAAIKDICENKNIILLEDNCESLGSSVGNKLLGNFGLASTFSFYVGHHISTVEGGMIATDDEELYQMMLMCRAHGWDRNLNPEKQADLKQENGVDDFMARYTFYDLAFNMRPTEITGFLGNELLAYWDKIVIERERNFRILQEKSRMNTDFAPLNVSHMSAVSSFAFPLVCLFPHDVKKYRQRFLTAGVEVRPIIAGNIAKQPFFKKYFPNNPECRNADLIQAQGFYFPNNPELTESELDLFVCLMNR